MKRVLLILIISFWYVSAYSESKDSLYAFVGKTLNTKLTIDSAFFFGRLEVNDTNYIVSSFVYIIHGSRKDNTDLLSFGPNKGVVFVKDLMEQIQIYLPKKSHILFDEIYIVPKTNPDIKPIKLKSFIINLQ